MKRELESRLIEWKQSSGRKPLVLRGARQVGKTYLLKEFGRSHYKDVAYISFEEDPQADELFQGRLDVSNLVSRLELYCDKEILPEKTLLILDEIQASPRALASLKFFCENAPGYHIVAAGSLLGIQVSPATFPVGKVDFLNLFPMSFMEFLTAHGKDRAVGYLRSMDGFEPVPIHEELVRLFKEYLVIGGMPEAVKTFVDRQDYGAVREIQRGILSGYELDFAKHPGSASAPKLQLVWNAVPRMLARENKKFVYGVVREGARAREYENSLQWLFDAGVLYQSLGVETPKLPLSAYANPKAFKAFLLDVGLLGALLRVDPTLLLDKTKLLTEFSGALTENYVAQQLAALGQDLYYWSGGVTSEVDFLLEFGHQILPLEVKAGINPKAKSLVVYDNKYTPSCLPRTNLLNLESNGRFRNFPLYAIESLVVGKWLKDV